MKTALKTLGLLLIVAMIMLSCESIPGPNREIQEPNTWQPQVNPDFYKLHHIRPTKPLRIPDTMTVIMKHTILENPLDTTHSNTQDSIPQKNEE